MGVLHDPLLERLLAKLHEESHAQTRAIREHYDRAADRPSEDQAAQTKTFLSDKLYTLDRDKAEFCYQLCRSIDARRIVEIGASYGVSTRYLAAAVRDNVRASGGDGMVIGTEHEPEKARAARAHFEEAGLSTFIDLREGDSSGDAPPDRGISGLHAGRHLDSDVTASA
jgi:predicted O-methyltransferase YrrM